jgi:CRP-like cAMP-binding protein
MNELDNPIQNQLLCSLSPEEYVRLLPNLERVELALGHVIYESGEQLSHAYFPTSCIVTLLYVLASGASAEIAVVGNDGLIGVALFMGGGSMPNRAVVQSAGYAYRVKVKPVLQEFNQFGDLLHLVLRYTQALITQMAQTAVCNRHHTIDQQLCRWLLISLDRLYENLNNKEYTTMITKRTNSKNYYSEFTIDGQKYIKSTKTTDKKLATKIDLEYYKQAVEQSKLGGKTITLKEGLQLHIDNSRESVSYQKSVVSVTNWLNDNFDTDIPMTQVDNKFLYQFVNKRSLDSKPATVKHNLGVITRVIKLCKKLGYDVSGVEAPSVKIKNTKIRVLTKLEETKLLDSFLNVQGRGFTPSVKHDLREWHDITVCLLGTGCRINEILELKWNQVDMDNRVFNIWRKKTSSASILVAGLYCVFVGN